MWFDWANRILFILIFVWGSGFARKSLPQPAPSPVQPTPVATATATPSGKVLAELGDLGPNVDRVFAQKALDYLNRAYASGCLQREFLKYRFVSLNNIDGKRVESRQEAYNRYVAGAPYRLDLRWYKQSLSKTIGYTYVYKDGEDSGPTETRIYSNTKFMVTPEDYGNHLGHELSHQARAGGFVHYTVFEGSVPYGVNDILDNCYESNK